VRWACLAENQGVAVTTGAEPVGRDAELARLRDFASDVAGGPCGIVIRGEAGIGKTLLWRAALDAAAQAGMHVLATRSVEAEMPLPLGGLGDLIQAGLPEVEGDLALLPTDLRDG
jgi:AAA ATPase domain